MKKNLLTAVLATICLLASSLAGCANHAEENNSGNFNLEPGSKKETVAMGRYVEQNIVLPQLKDSETKLSLLQTKDSIALYTYSADNAYYTYRLQADGNWMQEECPWISAALGKKAYTLRNMQADENGYLYLWYFDEEYQPHIIKTTDEKTVNELILPFQDIPNGYTVMGNGNIAVSYLSAELSGNVFLYDGQTGEELRRFKSNSLDSDNICNQMDAFETKLAVPSENRKGFTVYDTDSGTVLEEIDLGTANNMNTYDGMIKIGEKNNYYYLSSLGLQHVQSGGTIIETIIDGSLSTIGVEGIRYAALLADASTDFYILFQDAENYEFVHYTYDENIPTLPETQLSIYGLTKNKSISRAISTYQKEHPDVQITYYTAQSAEGATTVSDSIRTLNTELLSGKGSDILMLDGLPVESYMEKGVLADLSDILTPMYNSGELLKNFTAGYETKDGKIYAVPARFSMPILLGDKEINQAFQSMDSLSQYIKANPESDMIRLYIRTVTYDDLAELLFLINYQEIVGDGSQLNPATLKNFLETVKEAGTAMGATIKEVPIPPTTEEDLQSIAQFNLENSIELSAFYKYYSYPLEKGTLQPAEIRGIGDMMGPVSIKAQFKKEISSVNNSFIPKGIIGINSSSSQLEKAKDFVRCLLSKEEQLKDLDSGMPVNANALESYCNKKLGYDTCIYSMLNGKEITLDFSSPTETEISEIVALAKTLTNSLNVDDVFKEMLLDEARPFFEGTINAQTAADAILSKANTYLAE